MHEVQLETDLDVQKQCPVDNLCHWHAILAPNAIQLDVGHDAARKTLSVNRVSTVHTHPARYQPSANGLACGGLSRCDGGASVSPSVSAIVSPHRVPNPQMPR